MSLAVYTGFDAVRTPILAASGTIQHVMDIFNDPLVLWKNYPTEIKSLAEVEAAISPIPSGWIEGKLGQGRNQGSGWTGPGQMLIAKALKSTF